MGMLNSRRLRLRRQTPLEDNSMVQEFCFMIFTPKRTYYDLNIDLDLTAILPMIHDSKVS